MVSYRDALRPLRRSLPFTIVGVTVFGPQTLETAVAMLSGSSPPRTKQSPSSSGAVKKSLRAAHLPFVVAILIARFARP